MLTSARLQQSIVDQAADQERDRIIVYIEKERRDSLNNEFDFNQVARNLIIDLRANRHREKD